MQNTVDHVKVNIYSAIYQQKPNTVLIFTKLYSLKFLLFTYFTQAIYFVPKIENTSIIHFAVVLMRQSQQRKQRIHLLLFPSVFMAIFYELLPITIQCHIKVYVSTRIYGLVKKLNRHSVRSCLLITVRFYYCVMS